MLRGALAFPSIFLPSLHSPHLNLECQFGIIFCLQLHSGLKWCASSTQYTSTQRLLPQPVFHSNTLRCKINKLNKIKKIKSQTSFFLFCPWAENRDCSSLPTTILLPAGQLHPPSDIQWARTHLRLNLWQPTRWMSLSPTFVFTQVPGWALNQIVLACSQGLRWSLFNARSDPKITFRH